MERLTSSYLSLLSILVISACGDGSLTVDYDDSGLLPSLDSGLLPSLDSGLAVSADSVDQGNDDDLTASSTSEDGGTDTTPATNSSFANQLNIQGQPTVALGAWSTSTWQSITGLSTAYGPINMQHLSIIDEGGVKKIRQQHEATSIGTDRVIAPFNLSQRQNIKLKQTIQTADNFSWGTTAFSGKLGFGLGGGRNNSNQDSNPDGWTLRISWDDGGELKAYSYAANRQSGNGTYGEEIPTGWFIKKGVPFVVELEVQMNSSFGADDGWFKMWVDGNMVLHRTALSWMTAAYRDASARPVIDRLTWSEFHGGNKSNWQPTSTTYNRVYDVSYE